jgi:hypothetical protein
LVFAFGDHIDLQNEANPSGNQIRKDEPISRAAAAFDLLILSVTPRAGAGSVKVAGSTKNGRD